MDNLCIPLNIGKPAMRALSDAKITSLKQAAKLTDKEITKHARHWAKSSQNIAPTNQKASIIE